MSIYDISSTYDIIPKSLKNTVYLDGCMINRVKDTPLHTKNNATEFKFIIKEITKHDFNPEDWDGGDIDEDDGGHGGNVCICSKHITNLYYIKYINPNSKVNNLEFKVGSECVKKIDQDLYEKLVKDRCEICRKPIKNKGTTEGKHGCCSMNCLEISAQINKEICNYCSKKIPYHSKKRWKSIDEFRGYCSEECWENSHKRKLVLCKHCASPVVHMEREYYINYNRTYAYKKGYCTNECYLLRHFKMPFGKYKGELLSDMDDGYLRWLDEKGRKYDSCGQDNDKYQFFWYVFDKIIEFE